MDLKFTEFCDLSIKKPAEHDVRRALAFDTKYGAETTAPYSSSAEVEMRAFKVLCGQLILLLGVFFLIACPIFIPYLVALIAIGQAFSLIRGRFIPETAVWFNTLLTVSGCLSGGVLLAVVTYQPSHGIWWGVLGVTLVVGLVLSFLSWCLDWPINEGGVVIVASFILCAALTTMFVNVANVYFFAEHRRELLAVIDKVDGGSLIEGTLFGFGTCFLQRVFGIKPNSASV